jgi:integrase
MTNLKASLMVGRKPLTVNKLLTRISTIFTWAVNSGYLEKTYNKGLKISNGAESGRKAFSPEQVKKVMSVVSELPENSWKRWAMSIGIITGARIGEVFQLTKADVRKEGDSVVIDLNETGNKSLKNKHSKRLVPLVNGAYGFDLKAFLAFVESCPEKLFDRTSHNFTRVLNETLRDILDLESGEGLTFHSLRHSLASLMKHSGVQVSIVQDILGHSSQTITFDLYGGNVSLAVGKLEAALKASFGVAAQ